MAESDSDESVRAASATEWDDPNASTGLPLSLRTATVGVAVALGATYALPWVEITGPTQEGVSSGSLSAWELELLPEAILGVAVVTVVLAVARWNQWTQLGALVLGLLGTGLTLFMYFFLTDSDSVITVGDYTGTATSFSPDFGLLGALILSLVLVFVAFGALLQTFQEWSDEEEIT